MKKKIRNFILQNPFLRELFFFIKGKKVNCKKVDKKIKKLKVYSDDILNDVIISLTSYGDRLAELQYTLYSLVKQTVKPEKIIVNLSSTDMNKITPLLSSFRHYGVEFEEVEDTKSYKKLIPTMQKYPNKVIVTVDDDMYYEKNWLESLWNRHLECKNAIVAHCIYEITFENIKINPYEKWLNTVITKDASYKNFFVGAGGVLYPPNSLYKDFDNKTLYQTLTPIADDIWFYFMAYLKRTKVIQPKHPQIRFHYVNPYREYGLLGGGETLAQINVGENQNDKQFKAVMEYYHISEVDFINKLCEK